jgi:uncharacterized protein YfaS (alpha-2-macroglobulin family)
MYSVLGLFLILFVNADKPVSDINRADKLFEKGTYEEALKEYEGVFNETKDNEIRWKSFFRICESLAHLFRYGEAGQRLLSVNIPEDIPYKARILILKAELFRNFLMQYSYIQPQDIVDEKGEKDIFRLTPDEIKTEIKKAYKELYNLKNELVKMDIKKEEYFLDIKDIDFGMYPTLYDYLILSWTNFLKEDASKVTEKTIKLKPELIIIEDFKNEVNLDDPSTLLIAELMEEASRFETKNRIESSERWKIKRLLLPIDNLSLFDFKDLVDDPKKMKEFRNEVKEILLKWMGKFISKEGKAEAGYEAAELLNLNEEYVSAVKLCEKVEKEFSETYASAHAKKLRLQIQKPVLNLKAKTVLPPAKDTFEITTRNLKEVYFRIYMIDPEKHKNTYQNEFYGWSYIFNYPYEDWLKKFIPKAKIYKELQIRTDDTGDYRILTKIVDPSPLATGIYLVLASSDDSFKIGSSLISASFFNVTDLVLFVTSGVTDKTRNAYYNCIDNEGESELKDELFRFYTLNAVTGKPVKDVDLNVYYNSTDNVKGTKELKTDETGFVNFESKVNVKPSSSNYCYVNPLAKYGESYAYLSNQWYFSYYSPDPVSIFIETDRPIYRPGDKISVKVIVTRRTSFGFKTLSGKQEVKLIARDPNYKEFYSEKVKLNEFGSTSISFEIPKSGRLLGKYSLSAECYDGIYTGRGSGYFSVEEYKRPEFEIKLKPADSPWKYDKKVKIKGEVKYYFGGYVSDANVKYRIKRQIYVPWFYRYWFRSYSVSSEEIESGELKTNEKGEFSIEFIPTPHPQSSYKIPDISEFKVEVEGKDSGGRTVKGEQNYKAGKNAIYIVIEPKKGFFFENENIEIESKRLTINDTPSSGSIIYEVFTLKDEPLKRDSNEYKDNSWIPPLDYQLKDVPNDKLITEGKVTTDKDGKGIIKLSPLKQGVYRIIESSKDDWGKEVKQEKIFVVAKNINEPIPMNAYSVTLSEKDEYKVGETAKFVIGSSFTTGIYNIEIYAGQYLISRKLLEDNKPVRLFEVNVTEKMKGGFTLRWFAIKDLNIAYGETTVSVPWKEKKLTLELDPFTKELQPGKEVTFGVKVKDEKGTPQESEILALMYDRSLEYYMKLDNIWLDSLYIMREKPYIGVDSIFNQYSINLQITEGLLKKIMDTFLYPPKEPKLPGLRTWRTWGYLGYDGRRYLRKFKESVVEAEGVPPMAMNAVTASIGEFKRDDKLSFEEAVKKGEVESTVEKIQARTKFADTAFFKPHLVTTKNGEVKFNFTSPEQLTSWKVKLFAFTKDVKEGRLTEEVVTKKDLMVRLDLPRFFREKDKGTITAIVHNETEKDIKGELSVNVFENGEKINEKIKLTENIKKFEIKPHSLVSFNWLVEIPSGVSTYKVKAVTISAGLSDAEERELPILPSRERLIESALVSLSGNMTKKLEIVLKDDPTRINESMVLQIDPQLALSLLNTIPFLIDYPYECVEAILNKFVPLSIVNEIYDKYPDLKRAVERIPKRKTLTPEWEKDDPNRLIKLMETPWIWQSEGRPVKCPLIDLFNPEVVRKQKEDNLEKLRSAQLPNGGFPWWPGCNYADPYITLYVLAGFAEARRYGVEIPKDMINKALRYVNTEIPLKLKAEEMYLSLISYAAYVVTSFPLEEFSEAKPGFEAAKAWVIFLEKHIHSMTPLGKAYLAYTYFRLGDKEKANNILDMALDGGREDPISGYYWTPEKYSWIWYSDTVEKHAFFIRALNELRPEDKRIPGMIQWLLFNRKGNVWKSTKASSAAVYSLLDYLEKKGALSNDETFKVKWGSISDSVVVKADEFLEKPLRWQKKGFDITNEDNSAVLEKKGSGIAFASLTWIYSTDQVPSASTPGMLNLDRTFYKRVKEEDKYHLIPINSGEVVNVGDQIVVQLKINAKSQFEYMHLKDPKASGFESDTLLSGWKYEKLFFYEEPRDSLTNFFLGWIPHGEYILSYTLRPTKAGTYRIGAATLQSMYSPDMTVHSSGFIINVK